MNRLFLPLLISACLLAGGGEARAVDAEGAESPLANTGDCYIALHQLDDDSYSYDPYGEASIEEYLHETVIKARYYLDIRPAAFAECEAALAAGDASGGYWLGEYLAASGRDEEALPYYEKAAEMGDVRAIYFLGQAYLYGRGVEKDVERGMEYLKRASDMGHGRSQSVYAYAHDNERISGERDLPKAWDYYHRAAENGDAHAMGRLGSIYLYYGISGECATEMAINPEFHRKMGNKASVEDLRKQDAENKEATRNRYAALNIECDEEKGLGYLKQAAMLGDDRAISTLAYFYEQRGESEEALKWHALLWEWRYTDIFYMESYPYSPNLITHIPDYREICELQHVSQEYIEGVKADGGLEKISAAEAWAAETKAGFPEQHCRYSDYSWHYQCRN